MINSKDILKLDLVRIDLKHFLHQRCWYIHEQFISSSFLAFLAFLAHEPLTHFRENKCQNNREINIEKRETYTINVRKILVGINCYPNVLKKHSVYSSRFRSLVKKKKGTLDRYLAWKNDIFLICIQTIGYIHLQDLQSNELSNLFCWTVQISRVPFWYFNF